MWGRFAQALKWGRIARSLRARGLPATAKFLLLQPYLSRRDRRFNATRLGAQAEFDRRHSVDTSGVVYLGDLKIPSGNATHGTRYGPTSQSTFRQIMDQVSIDHARFTFIDIGSGKGAVLLYASDYPFEKIIGIEFAPQLHEYAKDNIINYHSESQSCFNMEAICADATEYQLPVKPLVLYLSAPFGLPIMQRVLGQIIQSYKLHSRDGYLIFNYVGYLPDVDTWLMKSEQLHLLSDRETYRIYRISC